MTSVVDRAAIDAALATVNDPEIRRPITEIGMVKDVAIADDGRVDVGIYLTVAGCPMRETITGDVTKAVAARQVDLVPASFPFDPR